MSEHQEDGRIGYARKIKIISGGQTGVDRAALDFALENGFPHGGKCPRGRIAEDGSIPDRYKLSETKSSYYPDRTKQNILESDATLIITNRIPPRGGTLLTHQYAERNYKPVLMIREGDDLAEAAQSLREFISGQSIDILNVAGPRGSASVSLPAWTIKVLEAGLMEEGARGRISAESSGQDTLRRST